MNYDARESSFLAGIAEHIALGTSQAAEHYATVAEMHAALLG